MTRWYAHESFCVTGLIVIALLLGGCVAPSPQAVAPTPQVIMQGDIPGKEEVQPIELDNCNGKADTKRIELYSDIKEFASAYAQPGLLTLVLWHAQGQLMQIDFQVPEQGVLDRLVIATATDTPIGAQATAGTAERAAMRADNKVVFKEAVKQYMRSAGVARKQVSDAARR